MRICKDHWQACRAAIDAHGLSALIAKDSETAMNDMVAELKGEPDIGNKRFDPLMSMNWHWSNVALEAGGLAMMQPGPPDKNDGHLCPVCELASHYPDFQPTAEIDRVADQMLAWARTEGLVPQPA